jgi:methyl-accepting chemotaxis protein
MMAENGWYDFFLIDPDSNIVFTVMEESDLDMNITNSELAGSSMGQAFSAAQTAAADQVVMSDFAAYAPSNGDQAAFMVSAITDSAGERMVTLPFRFQLTRSTPYSRSEPEWAKPAKPIW